MMFNVRTACAIALCLMTLGRGFAQPLHDVSFSSLRMKGVVIAICSENPFQQSALVCLEQTSTDYQVKGFFRIGLMPIAVLDGVTIEMQDTGSISNTLSSVHKWLYGKGSDHVEMRRVKILWGASDTISLAVGRVRVGELGTWELSGGVELMVCGRTIKAERGIFHVFGPQTGELVLESDPKWTGMLFNCVRRQISEGKNP